MNFLYSFRLSLLLLILAVGSRVNAQNAFITTWQTTTANESITIPINPNKNGYNYTVDWGDGTTPTHHTASATHSYVTLGKYTVSISGSFPAIQFGGNQSDDDNDGKIISIDQWGDQEWVGMDAAFAGCYNLQSASTPDIPIFKPNTTLYQMFSDCEVFDSDLNDWDVSMVREISFMFMNAKKFNGNISGWDIGNVYNIQSIFSGATSFNQDISGWNTEDVVYFDNAFNGATSFNQNLGSWDITKGEHFNGMLSYSGLSVANYDATLIGWTKQDVKDNQHIGVEGLRYRNGENARQTLRDIHHWIFSGDKFDFKADENGVIYVTESGAGDFSGNSWENATNDLQAAIDEVEVAQVWVAQGTYIPNGTFRVRNSVAVYGGFEGTETNLSERDWSIHETVLQGNNAGVVLFVYQQNPFDFAATLDGFTITGGNASTGGGIKILGANPLLRNLKIIGNKADRGAGVHFSIGDVAPEPIRMVNVLIAGNEADNYGGGIVLSVNNTTEIDLTNVTVSGNKSVNEGGGIYYNESFLLGYPIVTLNNSIVLGNSSGFFVGPNHNWNSSNSLIQVGDEFSGGSLDGNGSELMHTTPTDVFSNPQAPGLSTAGDYSLADKAYPVDAGNNALYTDAGGDLQNDVDFAGNSRVYQFSEGGIIDMGVYEYQGQGVHPNGSGIIYVKPTASGDGSGSSWANATDDLQRAMDASAVQQVWVAGGTYTGNFVMNNKIELHGHFAGTETSPEQRDITTGNATILDGNNNGTVVKINSSADNSIIEGVTIMNGNGTLEGYIVKGGGIYSDATLTIANSTIKHNEVKGPDGTVATVDGYQATGGGIYSNASIKIMNSAVVNNAAKGGNGYTQNGETGNGGDGEGGAIYGNSDVDIINSTIAHNTTQGGTGFQDGFGRYSVDASGTVTVTNSIIWDEVRIVSVAQNSLILFESNTDNGNIAFDGLDVADIFEDFYGEDYTLTTSSLAVDAGNNTLYTDAGGDLENDVDLAGNPRLFGMNIDMGAYENQGVLPIQLVSFNAIRSGNDALLQWSTATESNNRGFFVEHSTDGNNWNDVTFVATKAQSGNSQALLTYNYTDINPGNGQHFYRLRQVDLDGAFGYSDVKVVVFDSRADISVYPNPVRSSVTISGLGDGTYQLSLMNGAGQVINQYKVQSQSQFKMNMNGFTSGVYYIQIADEQGKMERKKVVKE